MKVTLSKTITCKLIFRVEERVQLMKGDMRESVTGRVAYTAPFVKQRR